MHCNSPKMENVTALFCYSRPFCAKGHNLMQFFMHREIQCDFTMEEDITLHGASFEKYPEASIGPECSQVSNSGCPKKTNVIPLLRNLH